MRWFRLVTLAGLFVFLLLVGLGVVNDDHAVAVVTVLALFITAVAVLYPPDLSRLEADVSALRQLVEREAAGSACGTEPAQAETVSEGNSGTAAAATAPTRDPTRELRNSVALAALAVIVVDAVLRSRTGWRTRR